MKTDTNTLLADIKTAASKLKDGKLKLQASLRPVLDRLAAALTLPDSDHAMVFVAVFDRYCNEDTTTVMDLANYYQCSSLEAMAFQNTLPQMAEMGLLRHDNEDEFRLQKMSFAVTDSVFEAVLAGENIVLTAREAKEYTNYDFVGAAHKLLEARKAKNINTDKLFSLTAKLEDKYANLPFLQEIKSLASDIQDRVLFYECCSDAAANIERGYTDISTTLDDIFDNLVLKANHSGRLITSSHVLITGGLVGVRGRNEMVLSHKGRQMFFGELMQTMQTMLHAENRYKFVEMIGNIVGEMRRDDNVRFMCWDKFNELEKENGHLEFVRKTQVAIPDRQYRIIYYYLCHILVEDSYFEIKELSDIFFKSDEMRIARDFKDGDTPLQAQGLVAVEPGDMFNQSELVLVEKGKELFLEEDADLFIPTVSAKDLIVHDKIAEKRLFFEPMLQRQLTSVANALSEKHYPHMVERLAEKNLPTGVAVLLYGQPGTGKTESVLQMARQTGRDVMHVDISTTKSCWFGESEKLIKGVFEKYAKLCKKSKVKPILLFNEADAVFGKRKDANASNLAQTENAIQNIILEEMEKLNGILVATTNLADNLDAAFERRFLFKIRFDRPTVEAKAAIWLNKISTLTESDAMRLAAQFDFSGGEIENIARKAAMDEIVTGLAPTFDSLLTICREEKIGCAERPRLGFVG